MSNPESTTNPRHTIPALIGRVGASGEGERIAVEDASEKPVPDRVIEWSHRVLGNANDEEAELCDEHGFSRLTIEDLRNGHMRAGVEAKGQRISFLYLAVRNRERYVTVAFFLDANRLVTIARSRVPLLEEMFEQWIEDPDDFGRTSRMLMYSILDALTDDYYPVLDAMHAEIEQIEDMIFESKGAPQADILKLKRAFLVMRKQIAPLRDNVNLLVRLGAPLITEDVRGPLSDLYNHLLRLNDSIDVGRDLLGGVLDAQLGIISNRLNEVMRVMTVISTTLMVGALVSGIYGMNFRAMPETQWPLGYAFALGLMASLMGLTVWLFKRRGYF